MLQNHDLLNAHETIFFYIHARGKEKKSLSLHTEGKEKERERGGGQREGERTIFVLFVSALSREVVSECQ